MAGNPKRSSAGCGPQPAGGGPEMIGAKLTLSAKIRSDSHAVK
jgi:hypothetical protein